MPGHCTDEDCFTRTDGLWFPSQNFQCELKFPWAFVSSALVPSPTEMSCQWSSFVNLSLRLRNEWETRRAAWKVVLAVCTGNLERGSQGQPARSALETPRLLGFSTCIFARPSSSIFKAETHTCRIRQILSFLIWKEGNGGAIGRASPAKSLEKLKGTTDFFYLFIYFNWRLITLQYCGDFCHTFTWISQGCTCVPHLEPPFHLPPHPIPVHLPWAPCLMHLTCTDFLLREMRD